jgi:hypothetical protein
VRWLKEDLAKGQDADYRFVMAHRPPMTAVARRQNDNPEIVALTRYSRRNMSSRAAARRDVARPPTGITQKVISTEHFVSVKVTGKSARIEAFGLDGSVLDRIDLKP